MKKIKSSLSHQPCSVFTLLTNVLADSSMLTLSFADVSNHPAKPCCLQYSSIFAGIVTSPCFCWSHCNDKSYQVERVNRNLKMLIEKSHFRSYQPIMCTKQQIFKGHQQIFQVGSSSYEKIPRLTLLANRMHGMGLPSGS